MSQAGLPMEAAQQNLNKYQFLITIRRNQVSPTCSWLLLTALVDDSPEKQDRHQNSEVFSAFILHQVSLNTTGVEQSPPGQSTHGLALLAYLQVLFKV